VGFTGNREVDSSPPLPRIGVRARGNGEVVAWRRVSRFGTMRPFSICGGSGSRNGRTVLRWPRAVFGERRDRCLASAIELQATVRELPWIEFRDSELSDRSRFAVVADRGTVGPFSGGLEGVRGTVRALGSRPKTRERERWDPWVGRFRGAEGAGRCRGQRACW
jgi:hypothetical protein